MWLLIFKLEHYPKDPWNFAFDTVRKQFDTVSIFDDYFNSITQTLFTTHFFGVFVPKQL